VAHAETRQSAGGSLDGLRVLRPRQAIAARGAQRDAIGYTFGESSGRSSGDE
jgi:hypothetical protein